MKLDELPWKPWDPRGLGGPFWWDYADIGRLRVWRAREIKLPEYPGGYGIQDPGGDQPEVGWSHENLSPLEAQCVLYHLLGNLGGNS